MKKHLLGLLTAAAFCSAVLPAASREKSDTLAIGPIEYRVTYAARVVKDTTATPYVYKDDQMWLDIGKQTSRFYSRMNEMKDSALYAAIVHGNIDMRSLPASGAISWQFFKGYPQADRTTLLTTVGMTSYQVVEKVEVPAWQLVPDSAATIMGYACHLAVATFKGRVWKAWYSEDLPLDFGPWKLYGLPGLVLKAYDAQHQYEFTGVGLQKLSGASPLLFIDQKAETVSAETLRKAVLHYDPAAELASRGIKMSDESGHPLTSTFWNKRKSNPIER
jgi:GLPGLI family protein